MGDFIDNVNRYIDHYGIKQTAISLKTGIEKNTLSRLLSKKQKILMEDMDIIAKSLDKSIIYFLKDIEYDNYPSINFSMEKHTPQKQEFSNLIFDFLEHIDAIMGIENKIKRYSKEIDYNEF